MKLNRRTFLRATVATAGSVLLGPACADDGTPEAPEELLDGARFFTLSVASGDPKPSSVILWTRLADADAPGDLDVALQMALDETFEQRVSIDDGDELALTAKADADGCVKARVIGLDADTVYYYRFVYRVGGEAYASPTGRTRTAPADDADATVRFAFVSCQDFNGRYYNSHRRLAAEELDFIVHLGDYIYETTGDPSFQNTTPDRSTTFVDIDGAIALEEEGETFYAASSLSNYRELYQTYRGDPDLQRLHERYPMIIIWDDHEFADDSHGVTTTMFGGREDETDPERRRNANRAWFEYMPVDYRETGFEYDDSVEPPNDISIYRDLRWGANLHLVLTDLRLHRADHPVPEDAFPGRVAVTQSELEAQEGALPDWAEPYVDLDTFDGGTYAAALAAGADLLGYDEGHATGLVAVSYVNTVVEALVEDGVTDWEAITETDALERGLAFTTLGKKSPYSSIGSRYLAVREPYLAYTRYRYDQSAGASESTMGSDQEAWFLDTIGGSTATWRVWGNEFTLLNRTVDTRAFAVPPAFQQQFLLSVEDWDGMPNKREELLRQIGAVDNVVAITGDLHAFFAGTPWTSTDREARIVEFVGAGLSSNSYQTSLVRTAASDPALRDAGATALALLVEDLLVGDDPGTNPWLGYADIDAVGFAVAEVGSDSFDVTFWRAESRSANENLTGAALDAAYTPTRFRVQAGAKDLLRDVDGQWLRWDPTTFDWVQT